MAAKVFYSAIQCFYRQQLPLTASPAPASPQPHPKYSPPAKQRVAPVPNGTHKHSTKQAAVASAVAALGQNSAWQPSVVLSANGNRI